MTTSKDLPKKPRSDSKNKTLVTGVTAPKTPVGIDNRRESIKRYGTLEPEGYIRHSHGDREGEYQDGGEIERESPIDENAPVSEARFGPRKKARLRRDKFKDKIPTGLYGGKTFNDVPGDRDIVDDLLKKPPSP